MHRVTSWWTGAAWLLASLTLASGPVQALDEDELLAPEVAFAMQAEAEEGDRIAISFDVAEGYYLYRKSLAFKLKSEGYRLGTAEIPPGKIKNDEFFGEVAVFRDRVDIELPLVATAATAPRSVEIEVTSQGCADVGVCYPPVYQTASLELPTGTMPRAEIAPLPTAAPTTGLGALDRQLGLAQEDEFLDPDVAFVLEPGFGADGAPRLSWTMAPGYYLYRDKFAVAAGGESGPGAGPIEPPPGKEKHDEFFGDIEVFYDQVAFPLPIEGGTPTSGTATFNVTYQGCADAGLCYPPTTKPVTLDFAARTASLGGLGVIGAAAAATPPAIVAEAASTIADEPATASTGQLSEQDRLARFLVEKPWWISALLFFAVGAGLAFTPCVFPMIPILSGIIVGQGKDITTAKAFTLSLVYVLAMAVTYTVVGILVGLSGESIQAMFQNAWVLGAFAAVFVLLSLSMFGFYELQMPNAIQSRLTQVSNSQQGGTLIGVGIMGFLSALIVGPCVTAPLIAVLIVIAQTGDAALGGLALFSLSMGMGAPLLAIGTSAGKLLPKAGPWMDAIKAVFGVLLIAVGIWLLERVLPTPVAMALWGVLLIVSAIYLGAFEPVAEGASGWRRLWKGGGLVLFLYGSLLLVGAAAGGKDVLQPLKGVVATGGGGQSTELVFKKVKGVEGLEAELAIAQAQNRPVMLDFYADWCTSCIEMEKYTFSDARVQQSLANVIVLKSDVTDNDALDQELMKSFGIFGPPAILFFTPDGRELRDARVVGFVPAEPFARHVNGTVGS